MRSMTSISNCGFICVSTVLCGQLILVNNQKGEIEVASSQVTGGLEANEALDVEPFSGGKETVYAEAIPNRYRGARAKARRDPG
jgi:hypothetical protein